MKSESTLQCSQDKTIKLYSKPNESSAQPHPTYLRSILILSCHLFYDRLSVFLLSGLQLKPFNLHVFISSQCVLHVPHCSYTNTDGVLYVCVAGTDVKDRKGEQGRRGGQEYVAGANGVCERVAPRCVEPGKSVPAQCRIWGLVPGKQQRSGLHLDLVLQEPGQDGQTEWTVRVPGQDEQV